MSHANPYKEDRGRPAAAHDGDPVDEYPASQPASVEGALTSDNSHSCQFVQKITVDLLGEPVASYEDPGRPGARRPRRPLTVTARITWIDTPEAEALRKIQGRALRAALRALAARRANGQADPPATPQ